jgi:NifU-like protein involved in Fe-S cluster formation
MSDYIDRGLRRIRSPMLPMVGAECQDDGGRVARFSLRVEGDVIADVRFRASPCVTLVAYCEVAAEWVTGQTLPVAARRIRPGDLALELPRVPPVKRDRALLASQALIATIVEVAKDAHA